MPPNRRVSGFFNGKKLALLGVRASNMPKSMDPAAGEAEVEGDDRKRSSTF